MCVTQQYTVTPKSRVYRSLGPAGCKLSRCKMASRWRTWDQDFFIDVLSSKKAEETEVIPALGQGRGKPSKDITSIALPKAALGMKEKNTAQTHANTCGRGRASVVKARALTDSPPVRRPGQKVDKPPSSIFNVNYFIMQ